MAGPEEVRGIKKPVLHRQGVQQQNSLGKLSLPYGTTVSMVDRGELSDQMIGRKILKRLGSTVIFGYVKSFHPGDDGTEESWTLRYDNPHSDDPTSQDDEEVHRPELDKGLHLQAVMEREFLKKAAKRGKKRPREHGLPNRTAAIESAESSKVKEELVETCANPTVSRSRGSKAIPANGEKKRKRNRKDKPADDSERLRGTEADLGKRIAKEFNEATRMATGRIWITWR
ncbi:unnamed protein product [Scytosiphon promiscuus]